MTEHKQNWGFCLTITGVIAHQYSRLFCFCFVFSVLQVFPDSVPLWSLVRGQRQHVHALQDHGHSAEPPSLQQHGGLRRPSLHRRSQTVLQRRRHIHQEHVNRGRKAVSPTERARPRPLRTVD